TRHDSSNLDYVYLNMSSSVQYCSKCHQSRSIDCFDLKNGRRLKTCSRHGEKRKRSTTSIWSSLIDQIESWKLDPNLSELTLGLGFDLDAVPSAFPSRLDQRADSSINYDLVDDAIQRLAQLISAVGQNRFRLKRKPRTSPLTYYYNCAQDTGYYGQKETPLIRDAHRMERFACHSSLVFRVCLDTRSITIDFKHKKHAPYLDISLSAAVQQFVIDRAYLDTPARIFRQVTDLRDSLDGADKATQSQVYYRWRTECKQQWLRDNDQWRSALMLLQEKSIDHAEYQFGNVLGLAIYCKEAMSMVTSRQLGNELVMDATYGTNNLGISLFAVLVEVDGAGFPVGYCFLRKTGQDNADAGATSAVLAMFLRRFKDAGFIPTFFGTDKDNSEISAIQTVWPGVKLQLCFWHAKRAIKSKLSEAKETRPQGAYHPAEALDVIQCDQFSSDLCWGTLPHNRVDRTHCLGHCLCPSRSRDFSISGRTGPGLGPEKDVVLTMFASHFNAHQLFPRRLGIRETATEIWSRCATEAFQWCYSRDNFRLWAYFWINWYRPTEWPKWARAANDEVPVLKTTMILESHWCRVKHSYLHDYNRPRIDLVAYIILSRLIPDTYDKLQILLSKDLRRGTMSWRLAFKQMWQKLESEQCPPALFSEYATNPHSWTCACFPFANSRFLLCKHLVASVQPIKDRWTFFRTIKRQRTCPFWKDAQLCANEDLFPQSQEVSVIADIPSSDEDEILSSEDDLGFEDNISATFEPHETNAVVQVDEAIKLFDDFADLVRHQRSIGATRFFERLRETRAYREIEGVMADLTRRERQQVMPRTWDRFINPLSMFVEGWSRLGR
ncbi:hypothetical protein K3495_g13973, partial [Podosphaera aphanis]